MKTIEQLKKYQHEYYTQHKEHYYQEYLKWCRDNPKRALKIQQRWRDAHPHYYRDYMRNRKAITEPLIFQFLDNDFNIDNDVDNFILYLQAKSIPEKHIRWFKAEIKKYLGEQ